MDDETLQWLAAQASRKAITPVIRPQLTGWRSQAVQVIAELRGTNESAVVNWLLTQVLEAEVNVLRGKLNEASCPCCHRPYTASVKSTPVKAPVLHPVTPEPAPRPVTPSLSSVPASVEPTTPPAQSKESKLQALMSGGLKEFM